MRIDERGILVTLVRSKGSQDKAETVVIPRADFLPACEALEAWAARVPLQPGDPIFRAVNNRNVIATERLTAHSVSRIVKRAARDIARKRGKSIEEAKELMRRFSGHSLRAGFVTSPRPSTCRRCASPSTPATRASRWSTATAARPTSIPGPP